MSMILLYLKLKSGFCVPIHTQKPLLVEAVLQQCGYQH
ncbi:hypothetical protein FLA_5994 [Filimonas lacunae]|nr:hypothetical protein FLA_5994 [Filimonas lacunae]